MTNQPSQPNPMGRKEKMKALSVRAPWWWFILHAGKDIENRDWPTKFRGTVYLHASKWWSKPSVVEDAEAAVACYYERPIANCTAEMKWDVMKGYGGCIVGTVDIVDCVSESDSPWFFGKYGFVLANPVAFSEPKPCKGALGFFEVPQTIHICLSIRGALRWPNKQLNGLITDDAGHRLSGAEVREYLMDRLSEGKKVLPCCNDCEGFSYETGCPGHEVQP